MLKKLIGVTGEIGSGKDTFCKYIKENYQNVYVFRFSDALTEVLKIFFDELKREDYQWLGSALKEKFGEDILVRALIKKANSISEGIIILNGVRSAGEAKAIKENGGKIVYVTAEAKTRWEMVRIRGEKADENAPFEKFLEREKAATEIQIPIIGEGADLKINNDGSKEELYKELKKVVDSI